MTLKEQFQEWHNEVANPTIEEDVNDLEKIADEFAINFAKWCFKNFDMTTTIDDLLKVYKEKQNL